MIDRTRWDLVIIGGGLGGVAAALAALRAGRTVVVTEPGRWLGGQLTSQGVPPDEHTWIEQFGATASYRRLRDAIRDHYRRWYPLRPEQRDRQDLNPGNATVSRLCHEPRVAAAVVDAMLAPYVAAGRLDVLRGMRPVAASVRGDRVDGVTVRGDDGREYELRGGYVLDATELGDLLPLAGAEHVTGFESGRDTGEPSAPGAAQPLNQQAFSWCFAMEHRAGEDHTIEKPADYPYWRDLRPKAWPDRLLGLTSPHPRTNEPVTRTLVPNPPPAAQQADQRLSPGDDDLWVFRRLLSRDVFTDGFLDSDVTLVNWAMIDYTGGPLVGPGVSEEDADGHLGAAREQSLSFLYWMQTEAPRPDGGTGWPGLRLRGDVLGSADGLALAPYIRESRRILARYTVTEQDVSLAVRGAAGAVRYPDTVGIGMYRIDLHPTTAGDGYLDVASCPFQIPLGALLPQRLENLLPAGKNIGTTHITNGCYRLHPVEWNIGEAAGTLAAHCLDNGLTPAQVHATPDHLAAFQNRLATAGVELSWPDVRGY
jgi:FAD-dependent oxidoreductase family protein